eukprot:jgi/Chlat1/73/Chrsp1S08773
MRVWLDCDCGVDDALGILLALCLPEVEVVGISCVAGNVGVEQVAKNVARMLTLADRVDVPFYIGASAPILGPNGIGNNGWFGKDGLNDAKDASPHPHSVTASPSPGYASVRLVEEANKEDSRDLVLIATGPLTNIALACRLDPAFPSRVGRFCVMGGAVEAPGNTPNSCTAEFNFLCDPEAAFICLHSFPDTKLLSIDCAEKHPLSWQWFEQWISKDTAKARAAFAYAIMWNSREAARASNEPGWVAWDPLAVAAALIPGAVLTSTKFYIDVELAGKHTRGQCVVDWKGIMRKEPNVTLVTSMDDKLFLHWMDVALE